MLKTVSSITNAIGALNYKGTWNASTNTPALASGVGTKGDYYVVSVAGSTSLDGISTWGVGDWVAFNGSVWQRVDGGSDGEFVNLTSTGESAFSAATLLRGKNYSQTSTAANTSIVDTGILLPANSVISSIYLVTISACPFAEGNPDYRANSVYLVNITLGYDTVAGAQEFEIKQTKLAFGPGPFSQELVLDATSWDGSVENKTPLRSTANLQLRLKISGYGAVPGWAQSCRITQLI